MQVTQVVSISASLLRAIDATQVTLSLLKCITHVHVAKIQSVIIITTCTTNGYRKCTHTWAYNKYVHSRCTCIWHYMYVCAPQHTYTRIALWSPTKGLCIGNAVEEDGDEPLQGVLVHGVNVGQVSHAEEEDLSVDGYWDVLATSDVYLCLCLLCH